MKAKHITEAVLKQAYAADYHELTRLWHEYGMQGCVPSPDLHNMTFNEYLKYRNMYDGSETREWRNNYETRMRDYRNISKLIDTIITHPEYNQYGWEIPKKTVPLHIVPVEVQLTQIT